MLAVRSRARISGLTLLATMATVGVLLTITTERYGLLMGIAVIFFALFLFFVFPGAIGQAAEKFSALWRSLAWWHVLWLLLFLSGLVFRGRDTQAIREMPVDAWAAYRILLVGITAAVLLVRLSLRQTEWIASMFRGLVCALAIYGLISVASASWSAYPAWTLYKALEYLVDVALLAAVLAVVRSTREYKSLIDWNLALQGGTLAMVWAGAILWPEKAFLPGSELLPGRISGVLPSMDANSVGECAALLAIIAFARLTSFDQEGRKRTFYGVLLALALVTLLFSQTRVAIVGFLVAAIVVLFFSKRLGAIALIVLTLVLLLSLTQVGGLFSELWQRGERPEELQSFSGRLTLWEFAWEKFLQRPLTGYGAYAGGRFFVLANVGKAGLSSTLSSYVEVMVGTGLLGLISIVVALVGTWWLLIRTLAGPSFELAERQLALEAVGMLTIVTAHSFFSVEMVWHPALVYFAALGAAEFLRRHQKPLTASVPSYNTLLSRDL